MKSLFAKKFHTDFELQSAGFRSLGTNVAIHEDVNIYGVENISIGSNVRIDAYVTIIATGPVEIGSYIHIASYSLLSGGAGIAMHDFSAISHGVKVYSRNDDFSGKTLTNPTVPAEFTGVKEGPVTIGRHVIVGAGTVIMPNVKIGEGSCVGSQCLVGTSLPEWGVYFGSPLRKMGQRSQDLLELETELMNKVDGKAA